MLSAILVHASASVATVTKALRRIAPCVLAVLVAAAATSCTSVAKRPDLVIETSAPAAGDPAFARHMARRRGEARVRKLPQESVRRAMYDDALERQRAIEDFAGLPLAER